MQESKSTTTKVEAQAATASVVTGKQNESSIFVYELKEHYSSREEVEKEIELIQECYLMFKVGKDSDTCNKAKETYNDYMKTMEKWLEKFPPESAEILAEKERLLEHYVYFCKESVHNAEKNVKGLPQEELTEELQRAKDNYSKAKDVQNRYKNNEISIDEAIEKLGIPQSKKLQKYYEQLENVE